MSDNIINKNEKKEALVEVTAETVYNFNRVDFNNPVTVVNYGSDVIDEMSGLMKNVSKMMQTSNINDVEMDEKIGNISNFNNYLEAADAKQQKKQEREKKIPKGLMVAVNKVFSLLPFDREKDKIETYADQFEKYDGDVVEIAKHVEAQKQDTLNEIEMYKAFVKSMKPYIEKLEVLIKVGYMDRDAFVKDVIAVDELQFNATQDPDLLRAITIKKQLVEIFSRKLIDLEKNLTLTKNTILECELKQGPDMELVLMYDSYVKTVVPAIRVQAAAMVGVKTQEKRIAQHSLLVESTNQALVQNSQVLVGNIANANTLAANGNITMATLNEIDTNIKKGIELIKQGNESRKENRARDLENLRNISASLKAAQEEIVGIMAAEDVDLSSTANINPAISSKKPRQKSLTDRITDKLTDKR